MSLLNFGRKLHKPYVSSVMNIVSTQIAIELATLSFYSIRAPENNDDQYNHRSQGLRKRLGISEVSFQRY